MSKPLLPLPGHPYPQQQLQQAPMPAQQGPAGTQPNPLLQQGPTKPTYSKRGKITIVACVPCRKRKTKCDGKRPECTQCQSREGQCHYDMNEDQRRLTFLRENCEHLQEEKNALEALLWNLGNSSEEESAEILRRLRAGTDPYALTQHIQAGRSLANVRRDSVPGSSNSYPPIFTPPSHVGSRIEQYEGFITAVTQSQPLELDEMVRRLRSSEDIGTILSARKSGTLLQPVIGHELQSAIEGEYPDNGQVFGLTRLDGRAIPQAEMQRSRAPNAHTPLTGQHPWVTVTDDIEFIDHLITAYFTWQHSFFQSFPETLFRLDMAAGRTKYCSRFLVNAICAAGCLLTSHPKAQKDPNDPTSGHMIFYSEAIRLLQTDSASSIPTVAGLFMLCHTEGYRGRLSIAWGLCGQSTRMALDLNLHLRSDRRPGEVENSESSTEDQAKVHTFWGCFMSDQVTSFTLGRLPQIPTNAITIDLPQIRIEDDDEDWTPIGAENVNLDMTPRPSARATVFYQVASLSKIVNSTLLMFFAPAEQIKGSRLLEEFEKYNAWFRRLPASVNTIDNATPHVLCLHLYFHAAILLLFRPFLKATFTESDLSPSEVCRAAANRISDIFGVHMNLYGITGLYTFQIHCLLTASTIHIINLPAVSSASYLQAACNHFHELVPRNEWASGSLGIMKGLVQKWNIVLPQEVELALFKTSSEIPSFLNDTTDPNLGAQTQGFSDMFRSNKRTAHNVASPENIQKRAKLATEQANSGVAAPTANMGQPNPSVNHTGQPGEQSGSNSSNTALIERQISDHYLFAPFPSQPAPLLGPVHTSTSADIAWTDELNNVAQGFDGLKFESEGANFLFDPFMGYGVKFEQE